MSAIKVKFEIGHESMLKPEQSNNKFQIFDWEVYVRGPDESDISSFVEYIVFNLHGTFQNPRRVVKDPPFSLRESGYASFTIPIEIHLRTKEQNMRQINFLYDLNLDHNGFIQEQYTFRKPSNAFKKKLLSGGGIIMLMSEIDSENNTNHEDRDSSTEEKQELSIMPTPSNNANKRSSSPHLPDNRDPSLEKPNNQCSLKRGRNTIDMKPCEFCTTFEDNVSTENDKRNGIFGQLLVEELKYVTPCLRTHVYSKILKFVHSSKALHFSETILNTKI